MRKTCYLFGNTHRNRENFMAENSVDLAVVGGGIIGLASAWQLSQKYPRLKIVVLEKEGQLATHQTGHNSGVIHSGIYYRPGSIKASTCVAGRSALLAFCDRKQIFYKLCGKVIVATRPEELPRLEELFRRARANGVAGIERIGPERLKEIEPHVRGLQALYSPGTGIIDFTRVAAAYAQEFCEQGGEIQTSCEVQGILQASGGVVLESTRGPIHARFLINCAGLHVDRVAAMTRGFQCADPVDEPVRIVPFRGEYHRIIPAKHHLVKGLVYPVPDPQFPFLGVHFTPTVEGHLEVGPNAILAFAREGYRQSDLQVSDLLGTLSFKGFWAMARKHWKTSLPEIRRSLSKKAFTRELQRLIPEVGADDLVYSGSGVRAQAVSASGMLLDDFLIRQSGNTIHVLNAPSPGATASLAIAERVAQAAATGFALGNT